MLTIRQISYLLKTMQSTVGKLESPDQQIAKHAGTLQSGRSGGCERRSGLWVGGSTIVALEDVRQSMNRRM